MSENSENDPQTAMDVEQPEETSNSSKSEEVSETEVAKPHPTKKTSTSKAPKKDNAAEKRKEELKQMIEEALAAAKATADAGVAQAPTKKRKASSSVGASASKTPAKKAKTVKPQKPLKTKSSLNKTLPKGKGKITLGKKVTKSKSGPITVRTTKSKKPTQPKAPKAPKAAAPAPQRQRELPQGKLSEPRVTAHVSAKPVDHRLNSFYSQILGR